ncbi:MAG: hypothetical protein J6K43_03250 [Lachnospiraceae bacterium]|nr:hypothetical protein [Lachnospiraceae bacterium]
MGTYQGRYAFNFFKASQKEMQVKIQSFAQKVIKLLIEANYREISTLFQECKSIRYSAQGYLEESKIAKEEKETLVNVGYVNAMLDVMQIYLKDLNVQSEIQQINTKYRDEILSVLSKRGTMLHGDLASALGVSASGLNAIIKKMNGTSVKLIRVEEVSKYKLYSITPAAYSYITANNHELIVEYASINESKRRELLLEYTIEINKIANEKKANEKKALENSYNIYERKSKSEFGSAKGKRYAKTVRTIEYTDKFVRRLA